MKMYDEAKTGAVLRARQLRRDSTDAEQCLWRALRSKLPQYKWRRQMPVGPYFADFACFTEKSIIELDGGQHASTEPYDEARTRFLKTHGYRLLRFWNTDVMSNTDDVLERIAKSLITREADGAKGREREVDHASSSPSQPSAGPLPLPLGEV